MKKKISQRKYKKKRSRHQCGRNWGDRAKEQAIQVHFNNPSEDFIHGVLREGKTLWQRVCDDWAEKDRRGQSKFSQGYWPKIKSLYYSAPKESESDLTKPRVVDSKWESAKAAYVPKRRRNIGALLTWLDTTQEVAPSTFEDVMAFVRGLNVNTVKIDREIVLKVMDLINRLRLRTKDYLDSFCDAKGVFDYAMLNQYCIARRDHCSLRKFLVDEEPRLELLCDMDMVWGILDEKVDLSKRLPDLLTLSGQSTTVSKFFEKDKYKIMLAYLGSFIKGQIDEWTRNNTVVTRKVLDETIQLCNAEAKYIGFDAQKDAEETRDIVVRYRGRDFETQINGYDQEVLNKVWMGVKNIAGPELEPLFVELFCLPGTISTPSKSGMVEEDLLTGINASRRIINQTAEDLLKDSSADGTTMVRQILGKTVRWSLNVNKLEPCFAFGVSRTPAASHRQPFVFNGSWQSFGASCGLETKGRR